MALTRNFLKSMGLTDEQVNAIIESHVETVEGLKKERDGFKADADRVGDLTKQLDDANDKLAKAGDAAKVQKEFDNFKAKVESEKKSAKTAADVDALLKEAGIARDSFRAAVAKGFDSSKLTYAEDGSISNRADLLTSIKADYADFLSTTTSTGTPTITPPTGGKAGGMTKEEIMAIKDPEVRQAEIIRNPAAFGLSFSK